MKAIQTAYPLHHNYSIVARGLMWLHRLSGDMVEDIIDGGWLDLNHLASIQHTIGIGGREASRRGEHVQVNPNILASAAKYMRTKNWIESDMV